MQRKFEANRPAKVTPSEEKPAKVVKQEEPASERIHGCCMALPAVKTPLAASEHARQGMDIKIEPQAAGTVQQCKQASRYQQKEAVARARNARLVAEKAQRVAAAKAQQKAVDKSHRVQTRI